MCDWSTLFGSRQLFLEGCLSGLNRCAIRIRSPLIQTFPINHHNTSLHIILGIIIKLNIIRCAFTTVNCIPWLSQHLFRKLLIGKTQPILSSQEGGKKKIKKRRKVRDFNVPGSTAIAQHSCSSEICLCEKHTQRLADSSAEFFIEGVREERVVKAIRNVSSN